MKSNKVIEISITDTETGEVLSSVRYRIYFTDFSLMTSKRFFFSFIRGIRKGRELSFSVVIRTITPLEQLSLKFTDVCKP